MPSPTRLLLLLLPLAACAGDKGAVGDTGCGLMRWYTDEDGDGYGADASAETGCAAPAGSVANLGDCADQDATVNPASVERCDGLDNDCDGSTDEDAVDALRVYADADGDGFGDAATAWESCALPAGASLDSSDCDESSADVHPDAEERCDGLDNDCDGLVDEDPTDAVTLYPDADGDGYGLEAGASEACAGAEGLSEAAGDCDDDDASTHPDAVERPADGVDQDCDGADACAELRWLSGDLKAVGEAADEAMRDFCGSYNAIDGDLSISGPALTDLSDLSCLCSLTGDLEVEEAPALRDLSGLDLLSEVGGDLTLTSPADGCGSLVSLAGLDNLTLVGGTLRINRICYLDSLYGLDRLQVIGGDLYLNTLPLLDDLSALSALRSLSGTLKLKRVDGLEDLEGLGLLTELGGIAISGGEALSSLEGLDALTVVSGDVVVSSTPALLSLSGLDSLSSVGGELSVADNDALATLSGLDGLRAVSEDLEITGNPSLRDIDALLGLESVGGDLKITGNSALTDAVAEGVVSAIGEDVVAGRIDVSGNGS